MTHQLVAGDEDVEWSILFTEQLLVPVLSDHLPLHRVTPVREGLTGGGGIQLDGERELL